MHALKVGEKLMKRRGATGPVRTVTGITRTSKGAWVHMRWTRTTKREGTVTCSTALPLQDDGLPAGYVLAKDRAAKKAGAK